jgi:ribose/xylose/arabinose/galactoside ABC-type transport system permease subunit
MGENVIDVGQIMVVSAKYIVLSMISGPFWAAIPYYVLRRDPPPFLWGGIAASPFIGLAVGLIYHNVCKRRLASRILLSLATLYIAVVLFGFACGVCDALRPIPNRLSLAVIEQTINGFLWGLTMTGIVFVLWPLSFVNHALVCWFGRLDN